MPEAIDLLVPRDDMTAGLWIRRVGSPAAVVIRPQRFVRPDDNKENMPPEGYVGPTPRRRRRQRTRKSPLPEWYPRTPLRDITVIVNALERRSLQQVQAARAAQANGNAEASPGNSLLVSPLSPEPSANAQIMLTDCSPLHISACVASSSPVEHPLQSASTSISVSQISPSSKKRIEAEEKLCRSIDQIEKIVRRNTGKKTVKEASAKRVMQRKTLMSMR